MRIRQASLGNFALPMIMLLLAGCLDQPGQSNFVAPDGNSAPTISGNPPTSIKIGQSYSFMPGAADPDGDSITFSIVNKPGWASFDTATGQLSGTPANMGNFADIGISVSDGQDDSSLDRFSINVTDDNGTPANSAPTISGNPSLNIKVGESYSFTPNATDADGDALTFSIANMPDWANFDTSSGQLSGSPAALNVGIFAGIRITVTDGQANASLATFTITVTDDIVTPTNTAPTISGTPPVSVKVGESYSFMPTAADADGDALTFSIQNMPPWASFDSSSGQLSGSPAAINVGVFSAIRITVTDGQANTRLGAFTITVSDDGGTPTNAAPTISGDPPTSIDVGEAYSFTPNAADADGDPLTFSILNRPSWASFDTSSGQLSGSPAAGNVGSFTGIRISVSDGQDSANLARFDIEVSSGNGAPSISGNPATSVIVDEFYTFTPNASDPDGDSLTFSIQNRPSWASFNTSSGRLSGTPASGDVGSFTAIRISVSDGQDSANLARFDIEVSSGNGAPSISGNPATTIKVAEFYSFTPNASDPDGDSLTFSIQNKPSWASFNASSGRLSGTPASGNVGTFSNIGISVSDGQDNASLPDFTIEVTQIATQSTTLSWTAPTQNENGTALVDLAGYTIHYGNSSGNYTTQIRIDNPGVTTFLVENLTAGTYYFAATAFNSADVNSRFSGEVVRTLP